MLLSVYRNSPARADSSGKLASARQAVLKTNYGDITIEFSAKTPLAVDNFVRLSRAGFYNGTRFHRVVNNLLIQGGDPLSRDLDFIAKWGQGGTGRLFPDENIASTPLVEGMVAMANKGPNTNDSQFFIVVAPQVEWLAGQHTVFASVSSGMDVVKSISSIPAGVTGIPTEDVVISRVEIR